MFADSFVDPFAHITIREQEFLGTSGNSLDSLQLKELLQLILELIMILILKV